MVLKAKVCARLFKHVMHVYLTEIENYPKLATYSGCTVVTL